ncbi:HAD-IA family hydrolase [Angustibacter aerolatus]
MTNALAGRTFDAVLFDMDGTLIDSTPAVARSWITWAQEHDVELERLQGHHGVPASQIVAQLLDLDRADPRVSTAVARVTELELADTDDVVTLPGAAEALAALPEERRAIVTSCTRPLALVRIEASSLEAPAVVVTADDVETGKPDPAPYLLGAQRLGVDPARCLVVEDAVMGLRSGRAAGAATLAVTTTTPAAELDADLVVGTLADVRLVAGPDGVRVEQRA